MSTIITAPNNNGLVGYWSMDEGAGDTLHDFSGNGNHGQLINSPTWVDGILGKALRFDGSNDYVNIPNQNIFDIIAGSTMTTVSVWIKTTNINTNFIFVHGTGGSAVYQLFTASGKLRLYLRGTDGIGINFLQGTQIVNNGIWNHIVFTYNSATGKGILYVNKAIDNQATSTLNTNITGGGLRFGRSLVDTFAFNGLIDDIRLYNRVLSLSEITTLYNSGASKLLAPTNNGLVGYWSMDEGSGNTAHDFSGNGNHGQLVNSPVWVDGILGKALKFNGTTNYVDISRTNSLILTDNFTITAWINSNNLQFRDTIISDWNETGNKRAWAWIHDANKLRFYGSSTGSDSGAELSGTILIRNNQWYFICITKSGTSYKQYINNVLDINSTGSFSTLTSSQGTNRRIGSSPQFGSAIRYWNGMIDEPRIYNRVLSAAEITTLYNAGLSKLS